jgi:hypothetical protein
MPKKAKRKNKEEKCMKIITKFVVLALVFLMSSIVLLPMSDTTVKAQAIIPPVITIPAGATPTVSVDTIAYMSYRPNPVGINQPVLFNLWIEPPTYYSRYLTGLTVTMTRPDGSIVKYGPIDSYQGDTTAWFEYVPDQVGTWKLKFDFPGNYWAAGTLPPGFGQTGPQYLDSAYYKPSSTKELTLEVQQDMRASWPPSPLPTDYWTRPVSPEDREWTTILGDYPWNGYMNNPPADTNRYASNYKFTPYVQAPATAHIVWKRQGALSGLMGGDYGLKLFGSGEGTYAGTPSIIFEGRCYQSITKVASVLINGTYYDQPTSVWQSYDLRTGEVYWEQTGVTAPTAITFVSGVEAVPGATSSQVGTGANLAAISGGRLIRYHPYTGAVTLNVSISPLTTGTIYRDPYVLSIQTIGSGTSTSYRLINWTMAGTGTNFTQRIMGNVSYPFSSIGTADYESMIAVNTLSTTQAGAGISLDAKIMAASLTSGQLLWNVSSGVGFGIYSGSTACADHGKFAVRFNDGYWMCWELSSGKKLWQSELSSWPWGIWGAYNVASAYGNLYYMQYDGIVAYDWDTGKIVWKYSAGDSGFETPYGTWPFFTNAIIADGKVYSANGEHSPTSPLPRGWKLHCINATTGEGIWNITGGGAPGAVADGYLTFDDRYDGYMYVYGKGESSTTITTTPSVISTGDTALIQGSVLDQSPAQKGTPCISKQSMATYMEYLHMQKPIPNNVTIAGVPVTLSTIDPNGNYVEIGTVTTDISGKFQFAWKPQIEGTYKVVANFAGDESYGSSWDETGLSAGAAPVSTPTVTTNPNSIDVTTSVANYVIAGVIAIIIAIAIVGVLIMLAIRKR